MIGYVKGILADIDEDSIIIDVNGMGIHVLVGTNLLMQLPAVGESIKVFTYTYVKEDAFLLYGFQLKDELNLFKLLISVSGIGPKVGLAILSMFTADDLRFAIYSGDIKTISKANGVGKKTAERLVLELKDKISISDNSADSLMSEISKDTGNDLGASRKEAIEALTALGYSPMDATKAVKQLNPDPDMSVEDILKGSLKYLL